MTAFLIALLVVVAFVWGQMLVLRPSQRDQRLMLLRAEARKLGLHARLLPPPDWYRGEKPPGGLLACYSLLTGDEDKGLSYFRVDRLSDGDWMIRAGDPATLKALALPAQAEHWVSVEARANTLSVWWLERGEPADLPILRETLLKLQKILS